jgi:hypothetical protein
LQLIFKDYETERGGFKIKWIDDQNALAVFADPGVGECRFSLYDTSLEGELAASRLSSRAVTVQSSGTAARTLQLGPLSCSIPAPQSSEAARCPLASLHTGRQLTCQLKRPISPSFSTPLPCSLHLLLSDPTTVPMQPRSSSRSLHARTVTVLERPHPSANMAEPRV